MYYKLPIKERMDLMKSYKKANKDMSYSDMVNDYNTSYQRFDNGGEYKGEPIITNNPDDPRLKGFNDSLDAYNAGEKKYKDMLKTMKEVRNSTNKEFRENYTIKIENIKSRPFLNTNNYPIYTYNEKYVRKPESISQKLFGDDRPDYYIGEKGEHWEPMGAGASRFKKPVQPYILKPIPDKKELKPKLKPIEKKKTEVITPEYLPMIEASMPTMISQEPDITPNFTFPKQSNVNNRIGWRMDPETRKMVPVYLEGRKQKVAQGKRLYNQNISTSTMAIPEDFEPQFDRPEIVEKTDPYWRKEYGGIQRFDNGGKLPYSKKVQAYNDSTILYNSGFGRGIPNYVYEPQFNAAKKRLTELNKEEPQSTDYYRSYANNPEYLKTHSMPYAKPTYPKKDTVLEKKKIEPKKEIIVPELMIPIEARIPKDIVEPGLKTSPKDFGYRRIGWRNDPNTHLQVPVLLTHPKMKVKQGERIYNNEIPTSTMGIPKDWEAEFSKPEETKKTDTYWRRK